MHANFGWKQRKINRDKASVSASRFAYFLSLFQVTNANARKAELSHRCCPKIPLTGVEFPAAKGREKGAV